jgi:hypothetical protein
VSVVGDNMLIVGGIFELDKNCSANQISREEKEEGDD